MLGGRVGSTSALPANQPTYVAPSCPHLASPPAPPPAPHQVMAGITVAQVIGAPLAAALLQMDGIAGLADWRW